MFTKPRESMRKPRQYTRVESCEECTQASPHDGNNANSHVSRSRRRGNRPTSTVVLETGSRGLEVLSVFSRDLTPFSARWENVPDRILSHTHIVFMKVVAKYFSKHYKKGKEFQACKTGHSRKLRDNMFTKKKRSLRQGNPWLGG